MEQEIRFEIWDRSNEAIGPVMHLRKTIYQRYAEDDFAFVRRAKRIFKKYVSENQREGVSFHLLQY